MFAVKYVCRLRMSSLRPLCVGKILWWTVCCMKKEKELVLGGSIYSPLVPYALKRDKMKSLLIYSTLALFQFALQSHVLINLGW